MQTRRMRKLSAIGTCVVAVCAAFSIGCGVMDTPESRPTKISQPSVSIDSELPTYNIAPGSALESLVEAGVPGEDDGFADMVRAGQMLLSVVLPASQQDVNAYTAGPAAMISLETAAWVHQRSVEEMSAWAQENGRPGFAVFYLAEERPRIGAADYIASMEPKIMLALGESTGATSEQYQWMVDGNQDWGVGQTSKATKKVTSDCDTAGTLQSGGAAAAGYGTWGFGIASGLCVIGAGLTWFIPFIGQISQPAWAKCYIGTAIAAMGSYAAAGDLQARAQRNGCRTDWADDLVGPLEKPGCSGLDTQAGRNGC